VSATPARQSKLRKTLKNNYVQTAILIMIVIGGVLSFWFGMRAVLRSESPFMVVVTGSMEPTLPVGSLIVVQGYFDPSAIYAAPYPSGDIVVFRHWSLSDPLVHRVVGNTTKDGKTYWVTLGDANHGIFDRHYNLETHEELPGLPWEYVIGRVIAHVPYIGHVALFMQTPSGRIIIIVLIVALIIVEFVPFSKKKDEEHIPEQEQSEA